MFRSCLCFLLCCSCYSYNFKIVKIIISQPAWYCHWCVDIYWHLYGFPIRSAILNVFTLYLYSELNTSQSHYCFWNERLEKIWEFTCYWIHDIETIPVRITYEYENTTVFSLGCNLRKTCMFLYLWSRITV